MSHFISGDQQLLIDLENQIDSSWLNFGMYDSFQISPKTKNNELNSSTCS